MVLLFADTKFEDQDLYRFLPEAAANVGVPLTTIADGRDIWQVFIDNKYLGNSMIDPCSRVLKRDLLRRHLEDNYDHNHTSIIVGYGPEEDRRVVKSLPYWLPWVAVFPVHAAGITNCELVAWARREGLDEPELYQDGFEHNNCKGGCIKAGMGQFVKLLKVRPAAFKEWEDGEARVQKALNGEPTILKDRRGGETKRMSLKVLRQRVEAGEAFNVSEGFACGCFYQETGEK